MQTLKHHFHSPKLGLFLIRLVAGAIFIYAGIAKLTDMHATVGYFASLGFGAFLAWFVTILELLGGISFVLGIFSKFFGAILSIIMLVVLIKVTIPMGFGASQAPLLLLTISLSILFSGCGRYSICGWGHKNCGDCKDTKCGCEHGM